MTMKGYYAFPKFPALLEHLHQIVQYHIQDTRWGGVKEAESLSGALNMNTAQRGSEEVLG